MAQHSRYIWNENFFIFSSENYLVRICAADATLFPHHHDCNQSKCRDSLLMCKLIAKNILKIAENDIDALSVIDLCHKLKTSIRLSTDCIHEDLLVYWRQPTFRNKRPFHKIFISQLNRFAVELHHKQRVETLLKKTQRKIQDILYQNIETKCCVKFWQAENRTYVLEHPNVCSQKQFRVYSQMDVIKRKQELAISTLKLPSLLQQDLISKLNNIAESALVYEQNGESKEYSDVYCCKLNTIFPSFFLRNLRNVRNNMNNRFIFHHFICKDNEEEVNVSCCCCSIFTN